MQWIWVIYWPLVIFIPLFIGVLALRKKIYITGIIQIVCSLLVPLFHMYFSVQSKWDGNKMNEFVYLCKNAFSGNIGAIIISLGYLALIGFCMYHFPRVTKKR